MKPEISQEQLNAFIDGELDLVEKDRLFVALEKDPELAHQLCALRAVKEMVSHGYAEPPPAYQKNMARQFGASHYLATGMVLVLGLAIGWFGRDWNNSQRAPPPHPQKNPKKPPGSGGGEKIANPKKFFGGG